MKSILNLVLLMIFCFGTASTGVEIYKYYQVVSVFQDELGNLAMDAMELAADDAYRMEHILLVDEAVAKTSFEILLANRYQLSDRLQPLHRRDSIQQIIFEIIEVRSGAYAEGPGGIEQTQLPSFYLKGILKMKPLVLGRQQMVSIPFELNTQMNRGPR